MCSALAGLGCALVLGGCAASAARGGTTVAARAASSPAPVGEGSDQDSALLLAQHLPEGADRCSVARPYRIDDRHKSLAKQVMQTDALAWDPQLAITAFASADYTPDDRPSARVMWLRSSLPLPQLRERLDARLVIDWSAGSPCSEAPCPIRGEVVDGAVYLSSQRWPVGLAPGAESHCLRAAHDPRVLELSAARLRQMPLGELLGLPLRTTTAVLLASDALISERVEIMVGRAEAGDRAMRARGDVLGLAASDVRVEQEDVLVRTTARYRWDDLEMLADDAARLLAADRAASARARLDAPPIDGPLEPSDYLARAALLLNHMNNALGPERDTRRAALHALLERGLSEHPENEPIALLLFELRMAEPERRAAARELAQRFAAMPGSDTRWQDALRSGDDPKRKP